MKTLEIKVDLYEPQRTHIPKNKLIQETLDVWNVLKEAGYHPADLGTGCVTMRYRGFKKLIKDTGGKAAIKENKISRINSVWIGNIEVCYTEIKDDRDWTIDENWKPLGEYDEYYR